MAKKSAKFSSSNKKKVVPPKRFIESGKPKPSISKTVTAPAKKP